MKLGNALVHMFTLYIPPDFAKEKRVGIFRHLLHALDLEIGQAKGPNHVIITGDFNKDGLTDMKAIAAARKLTQISTATRGVGIELDATFVSEGITMIS
jgi:hypothetical protein